MEKSKKFVILGIDSDRSPATLRAAIKRESITWPVLFDGGTIEGPVQVRWGVRKWPTAYLLDGKGVIRHTDRETLLHGEYLAPAVRSLVNGERTRRK